MSELYQIPVRDSKNSNLIKFISVTETIYVAIRRETGRIRKKAQRHGQCICPKRYRRKCDGNCDYCRFHTSGDSDYSLEREIEINGDIFFDTCIVDEKVIQKITAAQQLKRLSELFPEAIAVGKLLEIGLSERESLKQLGLKRSTYRSRLQHQYELLSAAIVERALMDYRLAKKNISRNYDVASARERIRDVEKFLKSSWFGMLSDLDGRKLLELLEE